MVTGHSAGQAGGCVLWGDDTAGALSVSVATIGAGSSAPFHVHSREDETFFVVSGELEARIGDDYHVLGAGDAVFLPRGVPHRLKNQSQAPAEVVMLIHPPGLESFFAEVDQASSQGPTDLQKMREIAARYGVEISE